MQRPIGKASTSALRPSEPDIPELLAFEAGHGTDPYVDYRRILTAEGGILLTYKDIDTRLRHLLWGGFAWTLFSALESWVLTTCVSLHDGWAEFGWLLVMGLINWLIVAKQVEIYRNIEIRPDCMILEGRDVFWLSHMENGQPAFKPDEDGNQVLCGIYGSRFVEYLTVRRFDDYDRAPDVFAAHLQDAMEQLWAVQLNELSLPCYPATALP